MSTHLSKHLKSYGHALRGLRKAILHEAHMKIHVTAALVVVLLGWVFHVTGIQWCLLILCIGSVISAELINTGIEKLCDRVTADYDPHIKQVKDLSAAAVLICAIAALITGGIIFIPEITRWLGI